MGLSESVRHRGPLRHDERVVVRLHLLHKLRLDAERGRLRPNCAVASSECSQGSETKSDAEDEGVDEEDVDLLRVVQPV